MPSKKSKSKKSENGDVITADADGGSEKKPDAAGKEGAAGPGQPTTARRAPGQKEVIPFEWKVCGFAADGYTLTLFKSIEKADSEAQLERLKADGYYYGLELLRLDEEPKAPPQARKSRADAEKQRAAQEAKDRKAEELAAKKAKKKTVGTEVEGVTRVGRKKSLKKDAAADKKGGTKKAATKKAAAKKTAKTKTAKKTTKKAATTAKKATTKKKAAPKAAKKTATKKKTAKKTATKKAVTKKTAAKKATTKKAVKKKTATKTKTKTAKKKTKTKKR